jgi:MFS superfamily sulfate permease-like transporter
MSAVESVSVGRTFARPEDPRLDTNRELVAIGIANAGAGLFQGFPGGGGTSQTAVNAQAGAKTQLSGLVTALVVVLALTLLTPLFNLLPQATLGATVLVAAVSLVRLDKFRHIAAVRRRDAGLAIAAAVAVVLFGALEGILFAVALSMMTLLFELNHPQVYVLGRKPGTTDFRDLAHHPQDETFPGLLIVHPVGRIYFANYERVNHRILDLAQAAQTPVKVLLMDASSISDLEYTVLDGLGRFSGELKGRGITLWVAGFNPTALEMVQRFMVVSQVRTEYIYDCVEDAVDAYQRRLASSQNEADETASG